MAKKIISLDELAYFKSLLANVAVSGDYDDLEDKPLWIGTQTEYETAASTIPVGTVIIITDDDGSVIAINYADLTNKPQINGNTLAGNKTGAQLGLVDAVSGKGLSTNDYTTSEKSKLAGIASSAQVNVIETITVNGVAQTVSDKTVALTVMTNAVNDLVNYYKKSETYTQAEVNALVGAIPKFAIKVVDALPTTDISTTTVYLLRTSTTETGNLYTEYIYAEVSTGTYQWEQLGTQTLDLSDYVTTSDLNTALADYTTTANLATVATSGSYTDLTNTPTLGTAAAKNVAVSGDAATTEVVMGNDSRLSDARTPTSHTHTKSEITDFPTLGTAAAKDVATTGNASTTEVVMGNDTRLTDARNAADVYDWAKASTKPSYSASEVGLGSVVNTGDSATPVANGTTKFTTGGAYTELAKKVDKVSGKGLSTNDYTTEEKNKLSGVESGAEENVIESVSLGGTAQTITNKNVDLPVAEYDEVAGMFGRELVTVITETSGGLWSNASGYLYSDGQFIIVPTADGASALIDYIDNSYKPLIKQIVFANNHSYKFASVATGNTLPNLNSVIFVNENYLNIGVVSNNIVTLRFPKCYYNKITMLPNSINVSDSPSLKIIEFERESPVFAFQYLAQHCANLELIYLPDHLEYVSDFIATNCPNLKYIYIPSTLTSAETSETTAFINCPNITDVYYQGTQAQWEAITGIENMGLPAGCTIHYEYNW